MSEKTLGKVSAHLIKTLYDENKVIFTIKDAQEITHKNVKEAADLLSELVKRNVISRLKPGKYLIIPQELGSVETYIGNWLVAGRELANSPDYYIAFYSAMGFWGMTTHPVTKVFIALPKRQIAPQKMKEKFQFVTINKKFIFGIEDVWADKQNQVRISDREKTILDALFHPEYCGGITEIAAGIYLIKEKINLDKFIQYIRKYNKNVIAKRLGYILEILELGNEKIFNELTTYIKNRYDLFDPTMPAKKLAKNKWRLVDNISPEQIKKCIMY